MIRATRALLLFLILSLTACFKPSIDQPDAGGTGGGGGGAGGGAAQGPIALSLQPAFLTVPLNSSANVQVFAEQQDGTMTDVTAQAELTATPAGVVTITAGTVTAVAGGNAMLLAKLGNLSTTGGVQVPQAQLTGITLDPATASLGIGQTQVLTVLGKLSDGTQVDLSASAMFTTSSAALVSLNGNVATAVSAGDAVITASVGGFNAETHLSVRPAKVVALTLSPSSPPLQIGGAVQLQATAAYDDATTADVTASATWSSNNSAVTISALGRATGASAGTSTITATFQGVSATINITVNMATLTAVSIDPVALTLPPQATRAFKATGHYSDGSSSDISALVQWSSSAPTVATVSNASGHQGEVTSLSAGSADIVARMGNAQGQARLTVTPAQLMTLTIAPATATVRPGGTTQLTVQGLYSDNSTVDLTPQAAWSSTDATVAAVGNAAQGGKVSGVAVGSATIKAAVGNVFASAQITVARQNPMSIMIAPSGISLQAGKSLQLRAMATYSDGLIEDASESANWSSSSVFNATVSNVAGSKGLVKGVADGMATITATIGSLSASAQVTVSAPTQTGFVVFPLTFKFPVGTVAYLTATATFSDGTTQDQTGTATWSSSASGVVTVQSYQGYTYITAVAPGMATITAKSGMQQASCTVTVTTATMTSLQITPAQLSLQMGSISQLQAIGVFSDLTTQDESYSVSWTSSDPSIVTVGDDYYSKGTITTNGPGTATITASFMGVTGSTTVTVTSATLQTIQVTPFAPKLPKGFDTYLRATGIYSDNTTQELTYLVSWTSADQATAAVSPYGELQPLQAGMAQVNATYLGVTGSTTVTVTNAVLQGISVTPNMTSIAVGGQQPFTATGMFSDQSTMDVTPYVTWVSSNKTAADVSNAYPYNGQATGLAAGSTTITAIRGGVTGTAGLTVH
jgi:uncharacterized protein YjdB